MNLAKPEFEGLWDKHKAYKVPKDADPSFTLPGASTMEKVGAVNSINAHSGQKQPDNFEEIFQDKA